MPFKWPLFPGIQWKNNHGFALVEVAIAMMILGALLGPGFSTWRSYNLWRKHRITTENQQLIFQALAGYLEFNGCLPCPIPIHSQTLENPIASGKKSHANKPGLVPYQALGLPIQIAKDGFGHWMTYAVDESMTHAGIKYQDQICTEFYKVPSPLDVIFEEKSVSERLPNHKKDAHCTRFSGIAVVLVSHGIQGWGAPQYSGKRHPVPESASPHLHQNARESLVFWAPTRSDTIAGGVVAWKTRDQMLAAAHIHCFDTFYLKTPPKTETIRQESTSHQPSSLSFSF